VLSERAAAALWPGEDPIGKQVIAGDNAPPAEVVGVVADVPTTSLEEPGSLIAYLPYRKGWLGSASLLLRTSGDPGALAAPARVELGRLAPGVAVAKVRTLSQVVSESVAGRRFQLALLALFAVTALLTACIGIYGVIAHSLARRRSEIGIRMALGAHPASIHRLIVREGLRATLLGLGAGIPVSLAFGRVFGSLLFEVRPNDPVMIAGVAALLSLVVGMACYVPARRATASDVNAALRLE
jgi:predicted lysophospholipase L1 biosynthesis ABC-type transport system permease subunit